MGSRRSVDVPAGSGAGTRDRDPRRTSRPARSSSATRCARTSTSCSTPSGSIPRPIRAAADFSPWDVVGTPERSVVSAGRAGVCADDVRPSLPDRRVHPIRPFLGCSSSIRVASRSPAEATALADEDSVAVPLPVDSGLLTTHRGRTGGEARGRRRGSVDLLSLPAPSFRLSPGILVSLFLLAALVATLGALALAYVAWPRAADLPPPEPLPVPPPEPRAERRWSKR